MVILRDEKRIARMRRLSQYTSLTGIAALIVGLVIAFTNPERFFVYELLALMAGWLLSQIGIYLGHRYLRRPRPDESLDKEVRRVAKNGRFYHYILPAPHVLLTPQGIVIFVAKFQGGKISVVNDKWKQTGLGFLNMRKLFGGEALGNPTKDAEVMVGAMANFLRKNAPSVEEVPMAPVIVFTSDGTQSIEVENSSVPVVHYKKLRGFLRQQWLKGGPPPLATADYEAIRAAFDQKAANLLEVQAGDEEEEAGNGKRKT